MPKPNILFLMMDQLRWDVLGDSGDWVNTPNMDRLAREGVRFANCVTNSPVCIPARVSLATGLYPHNTGIWDNCHYDLPAETPTWMQAIRDAGYRTSLFGKTHLHHHGGDLRDREHLLHAYGLDDVDEIGGPRASMRLLSHMTARWEELGIWDDYKADYAERFGNKAYVARPSVLPLGEYADVYVGQQAKKYLRDYQRPEPWFCWVSFGGPHEPWDAPEPYAGMYDPEAMPKPLPAAEPGRPRPQGVLDEKLASAPNPSAEDCAALRANYAGNVTLIDDQIGEILQTIEDRGELANTVVILSSDHGELNGDHGLIYKNNFLNGCTRVPLIVRSPETISGQAAGTVCTTPVEWFDIGPTLVESGGGELKHQQFAKSLHPLLEPNARDHRDYAISEISGEIMYLDREWKLVVNTEGLPYLLFDQKNDPGEQNNLVMDESLEPLRRELRIHIQEHLTKTQVQRNQSKRP